MLILNGGLIMNNYANNFINYLIIEFGGKEHNMEIPSTEKNISFLKFLEDSNISQPFMNDLEINSFIHKQLIKLFSNEINCATFSTSVIGFLSSHVEKSANQIIDEYNSDEQWDSITMC